MRRSGSITRQGHMGSIGRDLKRRRVRGPRDVQTTEGGVNDEPRMARARVPGETT